jgi:O-antigen/teichoic acid export membrane protein
MNGSFPFFSVIFPSATRKKAKKNLDGQLGVVLQVLQLITVVVCSVALFHPFAQQALLLVEGC